MAERDVKISPWVLRAIILVAVAVLGQTLCAVWWASSISTHVTHIRADVTELKTEVRNRMQNRYTSLDAQSDKASHMQVHDLLMDRFKSIEERLSKVENKP